MRSNIENDTHGSYKHINLTKFTPKRNTNLIGSTLHVVASPGIVCYILRHEGSEPCFKDW